MNGLDINKFASKKLAIAFFAIYTVGKGGADPNVTVICQAAIAVAAMVMIWLIDKERKNETENNNLIGGNTSD
jgi:hypothetical protein